MKPVSRAGLWVVATNVIVAGLLTPETQAPPAQVLDAMLDGSLRHLVCVELLAEYRTVLLRRKISARHGLPESRVDALLAALATHAAVADITGRTETAPEPGDNHLWHLLAARPETGLITGDGLLLRNPPPGRQMLTPRDWLKAQGV